MRTFEELQKLRTNTVETGRPPEEYIRAVEDAYISGATKYIKQFDSQLEAKNFNDWWLDHSELKNVLGAKLVGNAITQKWETTLFFDH